MESKFEVRRRRISTSRCLDRELAEDFAERRESASKTGTQVEIAWPKWPNHDDNDRNQDDGEQLGLVKKNVDNIFLTPMRAACVG